VLWWWGGLAALGVFVVNSPAAQRLFYPRANLKARALPELAPYRAGQRILVVSPHPDDESLSCAGSTQRALQAGAEVFMVWMTSGDGFELDAAIEGRNLRPDRSDFEALGQCRMKEAREAARLLGVAPSHQFFLGYPDGGLQHLWLEHDSVPYTSRYTLNSSVPYPQALSPGAPYTGQNLDRDLEQVLDRVTPDLVLVPSMLDLHPDHRATARFLIRAMARRGQQDRLRFWIVHGGLEYPLPKGLRTGMPLLTAPSGRGLAWERLELSGIEIEQKARAVRAHRSQLEVLDRFMLAFVRQNELLTREAGTAVSLNPAALPNSSPSPPA